jgi:hypothetical protein
MNGSGSDLPTVEEVFGTEREEALLSAAEDEVLDPEQLAAQEENELLMPHEIAAIEACIAASARCQPRRSLQKRSYLSAKLSDVPEIIKEILSAVLGDNFHAMQRPRVPVKHYVSLREAFFAWCEEETGMTVEEIEARKYCDVDWFTERVPRFISKPSVLHRRLRALFETFGPQLDEKTKKSLFNDAAWLKADGVLSEILDGSYSDPPDGSFYFEQLSALKEIKRDNLGIPLIRFTRGTNTVERTHKWMVPVLGNNPVGIELSDVLLVEMRHRMNMRPPSGIGMATHALATTIPGQSINYRTSMILYLVLFYTRVGLMVATTNENRRRLGLFR